MRVAFLSEGATEVGFAPGARAEEPWHEEFLLKTLVERILGVEGRIESLDRTLLPLLRGNQPARLCREGARFIRRCALFGAEAVVIVIDRDRTPPRKRWRELSEQRDVLRTDRARPLAIPVAIGVAVETIEAWLLADEVGLCDVLDIPRPKEPMGSPEKLDGAPGEPTHPKYVLNQYLRRDTKQGRGFLGQVAAIARRMDLDVVARQCPEGFGRFRDDVTREFSGFLK
jgi:hypothetical protein